MGNCQPICFSCCDSPVVEDDNWSGWTRIQYVEGESRRFGWARWTWTQGTDYWVIEFQSDDDDGDDYSVSDVEGTNQWQ